MSEEVLRQGPGGDFLHHQIVVLLVDTRGGNEQSEESQRPGQERILRLGEPRAASKLGLGGLLQTYW